MILVKNRKNADKEPTDKGVNYNGHSLVGRNDLAFIIAILYIYI